METGGVYGFVIFGFLDQGTFMSCSQQGLSEWVSLRGLGGGRVKEQGTCRAQVKMMPRVLGALRGLQL